MSHLAKIFPIDSQGTSTVTILFTSENRAKNHMRILLDSQSMVSESHYLGLYPIMYGENPKNNFYADFDNFISTLELHLSDEIYQTITSAISHCISFCDSRYGNHVTDFYDNHTIYGADAIIQFNI